MESRWTSAILVVLSLFICIMFVGQAFLSGGDPISTETALAYSMTEDVPFEGVYFRNETLVYGSGGGVLEYEHSDGSKVGKSSVIARRYRSESDIEYRIEIEELREQIEVLTDAQRLVGTENNQLETIGSQINEKHSAVMECLANGDYAGADALKSGMLGVLSKREIVRGRSFGYEDKIAQLEARVSELEARLSGDVQNIYADGTGYFVSNVDGYEDRLTFSDSLSLTADEIDEIVKKPDISSGKAIGKLIDGYRWRVAAVIDKNKTQGYYAGSKVQLRVGTDPAPLTAEIISITDTDRGDGTAVYVFECDRLTSAVVQGRTAQFKLIVNSYGGLRVLRNAIRYNDKEERGVYILQNGQMVFRKINVIFWGEDYVICTQEETDGYLKLYDKVITEGKSLYEGKVVD